MNKRSIQISYYLNIIIVVMTITASLIMFLGIRFMGADLLILSDSKISMFRYFTVDSNVLAGIASLVLLIEERKYLSNKVRKISSGVLLFKYIATVSVTVTFLTVFLYLGPISSGGIKSMLTNSNLFYHLLIPVLCIISFCFYEKTNKINKNQVKYGMIPIILYSLFYITNVLTHVENHHVSTKYDWYWFVQNGLWTVVIIVPIVLIFTYIVCYSLWKLNSKGHK